MLQKFKLLYFLFLLAAMFSCKSEADKQVERTVARNAVIDSTLTVFKQKLLKAQIDSVFAKTQFNGSVSVLQDGKILYQKENGFEDFKDKTKLNRSSVFAIGSVSKQFTAVLILLQEEEGKFSTEDKVSKYLTEFQPRQFENIKIKELLNHTSGISDFGNGLLSEPGQEFNYSNKGFYYLGKIIEKVSGKSYDENVMDLFRKAEMKNSSTANLFKGAHFASAYIGNSKNFSKVENMPERLSAKEISVPAGGILSTVTDLHRWNNGLFNGNILKTSSLKKVTEKSADRNHQILGKMGYGFGLMMNVQKPESYFHTGYVKGSPSLNMYYPETNTSVVVLSNFADESKGKNAVFYPHKEVKKATDWVENAVVEFRKEMLKTSLSE
ncbi:serine hydrolase domain-containing protein [Chryseobacterium gotjawalense]|uniref:Serine hydrolase domain-containing protein n=1 Tax=Chryseobacterium gotjawalense TaxID=3042315 RepID=A0ABY8RB02_9FLAO|nr:serine hydrolase domain-containing protein [Chryseobacterium sp. wdc7]WHF51148.1 serine hydrolase domain-containing protein [Chryseobacterium sp. wdc7]